MCEFLSQRPNLHPSRTGRILTLPFMCTYNSIMGLLEQAIYSRKVHRTEPVKPPIFILGFWRSGTTLLHNLMTSDPQFTYPTMYETLFPAHFLLTEKLVTTITASFVPKSRPMDNMPVDWTVPQEDEMALCIDTLLSPYRLLAFPEDLERYKESLHLESLTTAQRQRWMNSLDRLVRKITVRSPRQVVLKSPSHTFRVETLLQMYPQAKFVYIYRNPFDVFNSNCHLRRTTIDENTLGKSIYKNLEEDLIELYLDGIQRYERSKHLIPEGALCEVRYEELAADPLPEMERIYETLQLENVDEMRRAIEPQLEKLRNYKKNRFDPDRHWAKIVYEKCRPVYDQYGYPDPLEGLESEESPPDTEAP